MKIVAAEYIPELGISFAVLRKGDKEFDGEVRLSAEDEDVASSYVGCQFAEIKAEIKVLKYQYQEKKKEVKTLETLYTQITQLKEFPLEKHQRTCRFIRKQIKIKNKELSDIKECYETLQKNYPNLIEKRLSSSRQFLEKVRQKETTKKLTQISEHLGLKN